uniref:Uncharacterized protein n=1 Tax=Oryza punctata TaxID=4537 RepID=A0A0E0JRJ7_ORYPU
MVMCSCTAQPKEPKAEPPLLSCSPASSPPGQLGLLPAGPDRLAIAAARRLRLRRRAHFASPRNPPRSALTAPPSPPLQGSRRR